MWGVFTVRDFDLALTLESGQCFMHAREGEHYTVLAHRREFLLAQTGNIVHYSGADRDSVQRLLGTESDGSISRLSRDPAISPLAARYRGLRVMRLGLHETIIGFICSSNSNIPRIRGTLAAIAALCGERKGRRMLLPPPGKALDENLIREAGAGYRAPFIAKTNALLTPELLEGIASANYATAHTMLIGLPGVGPKVADCICLFALGHGEAFPVDVHVHRAMRLLFPHAKLTDERRTRGFAQRRWGEDAGYAQQVIFQWARETIRVRA